MGGQKKGAGHEDGHPTYPRGASIGVANVVGLREVAEGSLHSLQIRMNLLKHDNVPLSEEGAETGQFAVSQAGSAVEEATGIPQDHPQRSAARAVPPGSPFASRAKDTNRRRLQG